MDCIAFSEAITHHHAKSPISIALNIVQAIDFLRLASLARTDWRGRVSLSDCRVIIPGPQGFEFEFEFEFKLEDPSADAYVITSIMDIIQVKNNTRDRSPFFPGRFLRR
jgi:hypothetical protein